jgi:tetraacyldisaccharide 4'-kinase
MTEQPNFWHSSPDAPTWQARVLAPLGAVYAMATARRVTRPARYKASVPIVCVGNLNVGGTGKTPTVIALLELLGDGAVVVSRGYGGSAKEPMQVDPRTHSADLTGDEPLMMSAFGSVWVSDDRVAGVKAAEAAGAKIIILDDGFQDPSLYKDFSIVVVNAARGFGNGRCMPAGPLREPVSAGLGRADIIVAIGYLDAQQAFLSTWGDRVSCPICTAQVDVLSTGMDWEGLRAFAFAGIANPSQFFDTLKKMGVRIVGTQSLSDHQPLTDALISRLLRDAEARNAQLVTTEKDAVRLPQHHRQNVLTLPIRLHFSDDTLIREAIGALSDGVTRT